MIDLEDFKLSVILSSTPVKPRSHLGTDVGSAHVGLARGVQGPAPLQPCPWTAELGCPVGICSFLPAVTPEGGPASPIRKRKRPGQGAPARHKPDFYLVFHDEIRFADGDFLHFCGHVMLKPHSPQTMALGSAQHALLGTPVSPAGCGPSPPPAGVAGRADSSRL